MASARAGTGSKDRAREGALADDHGMDKLDRDMLRIGGIRAAAKGEQTAAAKEAVRHFAAGLGKARSLAGKEMTRESRLRVQQALVQSGC